MPIYTGHTVSLILQRAVDEADSFYFNGQYNKYVKGTVPGPTTQQLWATNQSKENLASKRLNWSASDDYDDLGQISWGTIGRDSWRGIGIYPAPIYYKFMTFKTSDRASISFVDAFDSWGKSRIMLEHLDTITFVNRGVYFSAQYMRGPISSNFTVICNILPVQDAVEVGDGC